MNNYFSHDSNARNDDRILQVRMKHGAAGYGIYFMILERLREEKNYMSVKDYNVLAFDFRVDTSTLKSVVEEFGLFAFTDDGKCFYSESFNGRMEIKDEKSKKRSVAGKKGADKRWQTDSNAIAMPIEKDGKESKEKESKEKKSKEQQEPAVRIYSFLEKNAFGRPFDNLMQDKIVSWLSDLQGKGLTMAEADAWMIEAVNDALVENARSFKYVEKIMVRRINANILTPDAIEGDRHRKSGNGYSNGYGKRNSEPKKLSWEFDLSNDDWDEYAKMTDEQKKERGWWDDRSTKNS